MKINVKTRIKYKGQEYSSVEELPLEARSAYEKAIATGGTSVSTKIVFNGQEYASVDQMPAAERQLYEDALKLTRDSGTVALEAKKGSTALLTNRQWQLVLLFAARADCIVAHALSGRAKRRVMLSVIGLNDRGNEDRCPTIQRIESKS